jgi:hypothetical protein
LHIYITIDSERYKKADELVSGYYKAIWRAKNTGHIYQKRATFISLPKCAFSIFLLFYFN